MMADGSLNLENPFAPVPSLTNASIITSIVQKEYNNTAVTISNNSGTTVVPIFVRTGKVWISKATVFPTTTSSVSLSAVPPLSVAIETNTTLVSSPKVSLSLISDKQIPDSNAYDRPSSMAKPVPKVTILSDPSKNIIKDSDGKPDWAPDLKIIHPLGCTSNNTPRRVTNPRSIINITTSSKLPVSQTFKSRQTARSATYQLMQQTSTFHAPSTYESVSYHATDKINFYQKPLYNQKSPRSRALDLKHQSYLLSPKTNSIGHHNTKPLHTYPVSKKSNMPFIPHTKESYVQKNPPNITSMPPNIHSIPAMFPRPPVILRKRELDRSMIKVHKNSVPLILNQSMKTAFRSSPLVPSLETSDNQNGDFLVSNINQPNNNMEKLYVKSSRENLKSKLFSGDECDPLESSPRKKPRKQKFDKSISTHETRKEDMKISKPKRGVIDENLKPSPPSIESQSNKSLEKKVSIYGGNKRIWKVKHHFETYDEFRIKKERKPSLNDLVNQKGICRKIGSWKMYHLCNQLNNITDGETEVADLLKELLDVFELRKNNNNEADVNKIKELLKGNMQRSVVVADQMSEMKTQVLQMLNHKRHVKGIVRRFARPRKKTTVFEKDLLSFLVRQQVLKLYRNFLRTIRNTPETERSNLLQWLRKDFKDNKHHTDDYIIKTHIRNGENMLKELQQSLALSGRQETPS